MGATSDVDDESAGRASGQGVAPARASATIDDDGLGNGEGAISCRIERVDFAAFRGFRDGAGPCFARSGSAAGIDVVTDTGNPSASGLSKCAGGKARNKGKAESEANHSG